MKYRRCMAMLGVMLGLPFMAVDAIEASPERLESDLREAFGTHGSLSIGELSSPRLSLGQRAVAEALVFDSGEGERVSIDRYTVRGDYDAPDAVTIEGLRVEDDLTGLTVVDIASLTFESPSHAVFPLHDTSSTSSWQAEGLTLDSLALDLTSEIAKSGIGDTPMAGSRGRLKVARIEGSDLAENRVGSLVFHDLAGEGQALGELGSGYFRLASLSITDAHDLDDEATARVGELLMKSLQVEADRLVGRLDSLRLDGNMEDGEGGLWLDALYLDLNRMIEMAPPAERAQLRMVSNVLTGSSGELALDAAFTGRWQPEGGAYRLVTESLIDITDAVRLGFDMDLPVEIPSGVEPSTYLAGLDDVETLTLLGGDVVLRLEELGLFRRIAPVGAAMAGVTEQHYIEQARTQARGFGMMLGREVQTVLLALVDMLAGQVSEMTVSASLPAESDLGTYRDDPLALPQRLQLQVETR
ncbi:hypothetical protein [Litchfieldella xinjiangensis]|uniref:hypothetical protein n=1 Tax=Litchfieldella xinjiangensis TaxID=1166948 RepID=UPI0005BD417E|nr:hypothetical protein [Halomonas xinjiangensis]